MIESVRDIPRIQSMLDATSQSETSTSKVTEDDVEGKVASDGVDFEKVPAPSKDERFVVEARAAICSVLDENFTGPAALAESYRAFDELMVKPKPALEPTAEPTAESVDAEPAAAAEGEVPEGEPVPEGEAVPEGEPAPAVDDAPKPEADEDEEEDAEPEPEVELTLEDLSLIHI